MPAEPYEPPADEPAEEPADTSAEPTTARTTTRTTTMNSTATTDASRWSRSELFGFRSLAVYFLLTTFPFPLDVLPWIGEYLGLESAWRSVSLRFARSILGLEGQLQQAFNGSGDTTLDYVRVLICSLLALIVAVGWTLASRRTAHPTLARWVLALVRYYLAVTMIVYGVMKIIPSQFSYPSLERLVTPLGDYSPMGVLWTFMGSSPAYTAFSGLGELSAGLLLLFRRTTTFGAAVSAGILANVLMLNLSYDVPVKLFSAHLLAMALVILWTDRERLLAVFWSRRAVPARDEPPLLTDRRWRWALAALVALTVGGLIYDGGSQAYESWRAFGPSKGRSSLWGIHDVESFVVDGEELPPLLTDPLRWRALLVDRGLPRRAYGREIPGMVAVQAMDGALQRYRVELDEESRTLTVLHKKDQGETSAGDAESVLPERDELRWQRPEPKRLVLTGTWRGREVEIVLVERGPLELTSRGFRWINEYPHNR